MKGRHRTGSITLRLESRLENTSLLGVAVRGICDYLSLDSITAYHVELCAVEAVTNVVRHAYNGEAGRIIDVAVTVVSNGLTLEITDTGRPMDPTEIDFPHFEPSETHTVPEGGMGLSLIRSLMDEVTYVTRPEGNVLLLRKNLDYIR